jgi:two-component system, sensor histidine kinase and response regulator
VESEAGFGSTFHFSARFGRSRLNLADLTPKDLSHVEGMRVLVVDDNATNRLILHEMLTSWRMQPSTVESGKAALRLLEQTAQAGEPFPLVILDLHMPEMDGFSVAERIKSNPALAGATIMMLTSASYQGDTDRCRDLGIAAYAMKPIRQADLLDAIMSAIGRSIRMNRLTEVAATGATAATPSLRILLAEDNPVNQKLALGILTKRGHNVRVAANGRLAVEAWEDEPFDIILMDVQMPEMGGLDATAAIRERERTRGGHVPIVAITARAMLGDRERCLLSGMDAYTTKPIKTKELLEIIARLTSPAEAIESTLSEGNGSTGTTNEDQPQLDRAALLEHFDGDVDLLHEIADTFLTHSPALMLAVCDAAAARDAVRLQHAAHSLKGTVANFGAHAAVAAALRLERMGAEHSLDDVDAACADLQTKVDMLSVELAQLVNGA